MQVKQLQQFLVAANAAGYAGGDDRTWQKQPDGSTTIEYAQDGLRLDDTFYGGEPYGGRMVVFDNGHPAWMMVYYGWVADSHDANEVYGVLRKALMQMPADCPLRGPTEHREGALTYRNSWNGDIARFTGVEQITNGATPVYEASYSGGLVDRRRGV
jgi:hypothetical protein